MLRCLWLVGLTKQRWCIKDLILYIISGGSVRQKVSDIWEFWKTICSKQNMSLKLSMSQNKFWKHGSDAVCSPSSREEINTTVPPTAPSTGSPSWGKTRWILNHNWDVDTHSLRHQDDVLLETMSCFYRIHQEVFIMMSLPGSLTTSCSAQRSHGSDPVCGFRVLSMISV